jgi:hypothetical protein
VARPLHCHPRQGPERAALNTIYKGDYSEFARTQRPPFEDWWAKGAPLAWPSIPSNQADSRRHEQGVVCNVRSCPFLLCLYNVLWLGRASGDSTLAQVSILSPEYDGSRM